MLNKPTIETKEESEIACVEDFLAADKKLQDFKAKHPKIFEEYKTLVEQRNALLEAADKVVRSMKVSCGPFELYQQIAKIDTTKLFEELGRDGFVEAGGVIETRPVYSIDAKVFETNALRKIIPDEVVKEVLRYEPRYHIPKIVTP